MVWGSDIARTRSDGQSNYQPANRDTRCKPGNSPVNMRVLKLPHGSCRCGRMGTGSVTLRIIARDGARLQRSPQIAGGPCSLLNEALAGSNRTRTLLMRRHLCASCQRALSKMVIPLFFKLPNNILKIKCRECCVIKFCQERVLFPGLSCWSRLTKPPTRHPSPVL